MAYGMAKAYKPWLTEHGSQTTNHRLQLTACGVQTMVHGSQLTAWPQFSDHGSSHGQSSQTTNHRP